MWVAPDGINSAVRHDAAMVAAQASEVDVALRDGSSLHIAR